MSTKGLRISIAIAVLLLSLVPPLPAAHAATYTVTNTNDSGDGSLRKAINDANGHVGADVITFAISGSAPYVISPLTPLPPIWDPSGGTLFIDGYTQAGASAADEDSPAIIPVMLDGALLPYQPDDNPINNGLWIASSANTIRGLTIIGFPHNGIVIAPIPVTPWLSANDNTVEGCHVGARNSATVAAGNSWDGIFIGYGASNNTIGGVDPEDANVVSGNDLIGVDVYYAGTTGNVITGNRIGTVGSGDGPLENGWHGVRIYGSASANTVGGDSSGEGNVISGNGRSGVQLLGPGTNNNAVSGNIIGLNHIGGAAVANGESGVIIQATTGGPQSNTIGGDSAGERNVISGNHGNGVTLVGVGTQANTVSGNYIGLNQAGTLDRGNWSDGVSLEGGATGNTIGGDAVGERNVISGNDQYGVSLSGSGTDANTIAGNYIGTDPAGAAAIGNWWEGVRFENGPADNVLGGSTADSGNLISGNESRGVSFDDAGTGNQVAANTIGLDVTGRSPLANDGDGILVFGPATGMTIGGASPDQGNVIGANAGEGIKLNGTSGVVVRGNFIGVDRGRTVELGNTSSGVYAGNGAADITIGPDNVILNNHGGGVSISTDTNIRNVVTRNVLNSNLGPQLYVTTGANGGILPPTITSTALGSVEIAGSACNGCAVEVFGNSSSGWRGEHYLGTATAIGGVWTLTLSGLAYPYLTATATDPSLGTSEFCYSFTATVRSLFLPLLLRQFP